MSDVWIRKMRTYFQRLDFDKDGVVSRADFERMGERIGDLEKFDPVQKETARQRFSDEVTRLYLRSALFNRRNLKMSDIWTRKMRTHFRRIDFDNDGVVRRADFERMGERLGDQEKCDPVKKETARRRFSELFSKYTKAAGTKDDVLMTEDLMIESIKMQKDDPAFKKAVSDMLYSVFNAMDVNQDGYLDFQEYRRFFENLGFVDSEFTKKAFVAIDANHDGKLSFEEFVNAANDYLCSDDESSAAMFGLLF